MPWPKEWVMVARRGLKVSVKRNLNKEVEGETLGGSQNAF